MKIVDGMAAYVSGAGSGIGRALACRLATRGVSVGVCDIALEMASETVRLIESGGGRAIAIETDVSDPTSVEAAVEQIEARFGPVRIACNDAGVAMHGTPLHQVELSEWDWVIGVNVYGVINGIRTFVPRFLERRDPAHILNTASIGGFQVNPAFLTGPYSVTKYAVVALSEALHNELAGTPIGVSVLAPAAVATSIHLSERHRPARFGGATVRPQNHFMGDLIKHGASPDEIGQQVLAAIEGGEFYIFTHPESQRLLDERHGRILQAFARAGSRT